MKAKYFALCGAVLLAGSLPAAAHQGKSSVRDLNSVKSGSSSQMERMGDSTRQLFDRKTFGSDVQALEGHGAKRIGSEDAYGSIGRGATREVSRPSQDWRNKAVFGVEPNLEY